jgi:hypothetical protein
MPTSRLNTATELASGLERPFDAAGVDAGGEDVRAIGPELHGALSVLGVVDGIYIVVADMPLGVRLSAGRCNSDFTWSLAPDEIEGLSVIVPGSAEQEFALTVRVVTPDPDGYDFASTTAQFNVVVGSAGSAVPFNSLKRIEPLEPRDWPVIVRSAYDRHLSQIGAAVTEDPRPAKRRTDAAGEGRRSREPAAAHAAAMAETRQLAAARLEWEAEEAIRLARSHSRWAVEAEEVWRLRANDLARYYEGRLAENEARWRMREAERIAAVDASWAARIVAAEARWRAEQPQQAQQAPAKRRPLLGRYRRPIDFCLAVSIAAVALLVV